MDKLTNTNIKVSANEIFDRYTLNRNFLKLFKNDQQILDLLKLAGQDLFALRSYYRGHTYQRGDFCLFTTKYKDDILVFILQCLIDNNTNYPEFKIVNYDVSFEDSGWLIKNSVSIFLNHTITTYINSIYKKKLLVLHDYNLSYHKYGEIPDMPALNTKVLKKDFSNIKEDRETNFYPHETIALQSDDVIVSGWYRRWDNGLLEYDIIYKLAYSKMSEEVGVEYSVLKCNDLTILDSDENPEDTTYNENNKYFASDEDKIMFKLKSSKQSMIENTIQTNRVPWMNVYSATIEFPVLFKDINYMIFDSSITNQERNTDLPTIDSGTNKVVYVNKCRKSITPMYIMNDLIKDPTKAGLLLNTFHCKIVGRWK